MQPLLPAADISTHATLAETMIENAGELIKQQTGGVRGNRTKQAETGVQAVLTALTDGVSPKKPTAVGKRRGSKASSHSSRGCTTDRQVDAPSQDASIDRLKPAQEGTSGSSRAK